MIKKVAYVLIVFCVMPILGMQEMDNRSDEWISVHNSFVAYDINIKNDITIGDLKKSVESISNISVEDQSLCAFRDLMFVTKVGEPLGDTARIRDIMSHYTTHEFMLSVALSGIIVEK